MDQKAGWIGVDRAEQHGLLYAVICAVPLMLAARFGPWFLLGLPMAIVLSITVGIVMHRYVPRHWDQPRFGAVPWNEGLGQPEWQRTAGKSSAAGTGQAERVMPSLARARRRDRAESERLRRLP